MPSGKFNLNVHSTAKLNRNYLKGGCMVHYRNGLSSVWLGSLLSEDKPANCTRLRRKTGFVGGPGSLEKRYAVRGTFMRASCLNFDHAGALSVRTMAKSSRRLRSSTNRSSPNDERCVLGLMD
ncbi:kynureninase [Anopheles sinensis]|uniref:Kynureninase n=1 Tax=Anopheles sinensis TaxID=74873 RepID=A0A084WLA4_ANOSI|nr:kynureninase [Anopheles sinensis]